MDSWDTEASGASAACARRRSIRGGQYDAFSHGSCALVGVPR